MQDEQITKAREALQRAERVVVFSGAGLSAESGISTFRGAQDNALWSRYDPMKLASLAGFAEDAATVIDWYSWRRQTLAGAEPNRAHLALAAHPALLQITQNVDDLLERAGVPASQILHLHGSIIKDRCHANCGVEENVSLEDPPALHRCVKCGALMRPTVVWFGESLPAGVWQEAERACRQSDCLLVVGTSASVYPAAGLIDLAQNAGSQVIIVNTEWSEAGSRSQHQLIGPAGLILPELLKGLPSYQDLAGC